MAKGKTNQPLVFAIPAAWVDKPLFQELMAKGHTYIILPTEVTNADIVFGLNCHILDEGMMEQKGMVDVALRAARKRKKEKK